MTLPRYCWHALLGSTLLACTTHQAAPLPPPAANPVAAHAAVDSQLAQVQLAYRQRNGAALAASYTVDAVVNSPEGNFVGRPAVEAHLQKALAAVTSITADSVITDAFDLSDDHAVEWGHVTWTQVTGGHAPAHVRRDFVYLWRKEGDGVWRIARDLDFVSTAR